MQLKIVSSIVITEYKFQGSGENCEWSYLVDSGCGDFPWSAQTHRVDFGPLVCSNSGGNRPVKVFLYSLKS